MLSDASPYCDVRFAPRVITVLARCGAWYDRARGWPLNKGSPEHTCIYEGGTDTPHNNLTCVVQDRFQNFPKFNPLTFRISKFSEIHKLPDLVDRIFLKHKGELSGKSVFLKFWKLWKAARILEIDFGRADCHPSDDRPCTTTHKKGHGLSTGGATIYIYMYIHTYTYIDVITCMHVCICSFLHAYLLTYIHIHICFMLKHRYVQM